MTQHMTTTSIIMAAGRGSRMKGYAGNKALLPLVPGDTLFCGENPLLVHILEALPEGPKGIIVNHCKDAVMTTACGEGISFCEQPVLNGTGGALIAAGEFLQTQPCERIIITMGDVPFVRPETYAKLVCLLEDADIAVLGFSPADKKQYGVLEIVGDRVKKITEWKYWKEYDEEKRSALSVCNSGIYAVTKTMLQKYLPILESRPQTVCKERDGKMVEIQEFFMTDLIEYMAADGKVIRYLVAEDEIETMGVDDADALQKAQAFYASRS